jgi:hypothetical protein
MVVSCFVVLVQTLDPSSESPAAAITSRPRVRVPICDRKPSSVFHQLLTLRATLTKHRRLSLSFGTQDPPNATGAEVDSFFVIDGPSVEF